MAETILTGRSDRIRSALQKLKDEGVDAAVVVTRDGIVIHAEMQAGDEEKESFAAMAAALLGAAETATSELRQGVPKRVILESGDRKIVEVGAGPTALLVTSFGPGVQLSRLLAGIDRTAYEIREIIRDQ